MADPSEPKKITNINYNCLERIFDFLDLKSLFNVAHTCKRLQIAAAAKFGDEHGEKGVRLEPNHFDIITGDSRIQMYESTIWVERNKCLPFLRCFGSKISGLWICCNDLDNRPDPLLEPLYRYVNEYCSDTLTRINLVDDRTSLNKLFEKPFRNVVDVAIKCLHSKVQLSKLANWFPNVRRLDVHYLDRRVPGMDQTTAEVYFPHLEHLQLFEALLPNENATKLLHSNKQLQSLEISASNGMTLSELSNMISGNPSIVKLTVGIHIMRNMVPVTMAELMRFVSEHPILIELGLIDYRLSVVDVNILLGQLKSLKKFVFYVNDRSECDHILNQLRNEWQHTVDDTSNRLRIILNRCEENQNV